MKISVVLVSFLLLLCACEKVAEVITPYNASLRIREQFDENAVLVDDYFINDRIMISATELRTKRSQFGERDLFLKHMLELTEPAYGEVITGSTLPAAHKVIPTSTRAEQKMLKHLLPFSSGYTGPSPGSGALDNFAKEILDSINARLDLDQPLINSYSISSHNASAIEQFTLGFSEIKTNYQKMLQLISTATSTSVLDDGIEEMLAAASPEEAILIGLLLPAVQKVREGNNPYSNLVNNYFDMSTSERSTWDRDARLAGFLGAYDFIISHEYNPKDEFTTSVEVNKAICRSVTVLAWARVN